MKSRSLLELLGIQMRVFIWKWKKEGARAKAAKEKAERDRIIGLKDMLAPLPQPFRHIGTYPANVVHYPEFHEQMRKMAEEQRRQLTNIEPFETPLIPWKDRVDQSMVLMTDPMMLEVMRRAHDIRIKSTET